MSLPQWRRCHPSVRRSQGLPVRQENALLRDEFMNVTGSFQISQLALWLALPQGNSCQFMATRDKMVEEPTQATYSDNAVVSACSVKGWQLVASGDKKKCMERVTGIEPVMPAWKAGALPLCNTRICL
jgi:hypothetical protein